MPNAPPTPLTFYGYLSRAASSPDYFFAATFFINLSCSAIALARWSSIILQHSIVASRVHVVLEASFLHFVVRLGRSRQVLVDRIQGSQRLLVVARCRMLTHRGKVLLRLRDVRADGIGGLAGRLRRDLFVRSALGVLPVIAGRVAGAAHRTAGGTAGEVVFAANLGTSVPLSKSCAGGDDKRKKGQGNQWSGVLSHGKSSQIKDRTAVVLAAKLRPVLWRRDRPSVRCLERLDAGSCRFLRKCSAKIDGQPLVQDRHGRRSHFVGEFRHFHEYPWYTWNPSAKVALPVRLRAYVGEYARFVRGSGFAEAQLADKL